MTIVRAVSEVVTNTRIVWNDGVWAVLVVGHWGSYVWGWVTYFVVQEKEAEDVVIDRMVVEVGETVAVGPVCVFDEVEATGGEV